MSADKKIIDAMWDDTPVDVSTEVGFIWSIANTLRGPYQSDKYKELLLYAYQHTAYYHRIFDEIGNFVSSLFIEDTTD